MHSFQLIGWACWLGAMAAPVPGGQKRPRLSDEEAISRLGKLQNPSPIPVDSGYIKYLRIQKTGSTSFFKGLRAISKVGCESAGYRAVKGEFSGPFCISNEQRVFRPIQREYCCCHCVARDYIAATRQRAARAGRSGCRLFIHAHADYTDLTEPFIEAGEPTALLATIIRHPLDRTVSEFYNMASETTQDARRLRAFVWDYNVTFLWPEIRRWQAAKDRVKRHNSSEATIELATATEAMFVKWFEEPAARRRHTNRGTRYVLGTYVFDRLVSAGGDADTDAITAATKNLAKFDVVGVTERQDLALAMVGYMFGIVGSGVTESQTQGQGAGCQHAAGQNDRCFHERPKLNTRGSKIGHAVWEPNQAMKRRIRAANGMDVALFELASSFLDAKVDALLGADSGVTGSYEPGRVHPADVAGGYIPSSKDLGCPPRKDDYQKRKKRLPGLRKANDVASRGRKPRQ